MNVVGELLNTFGSAIGMNCILVEPAVSLKKRYTSSRILRVYSVNHGQGIEGISYLCKSLTALKTFWKVGPPLLVFSVDVMQSLRPVDAYSDEKVVFFEKRAPLFIQQGSICLEIVGNLLARRAVKSLVIDNLFEEVDSK